MKKLLFLLFFFPITVYSMESLQPVSAPITKEIITNYFATLQKNPRTEGKNFEEIIDFYRGRSATKNVTIIFETSYTVAKKNIENHDAIESSLLYRIVAKLKETTNAELKSVSLDQYTKAEVHQDNKNWCIVCKTSIRYETLLAWFKK